MNVSHGIRAALLLHVLYFGAAAAATVYVVSEAWHYGFFFTAWPAILTGMALMFIGASVVGLLYLTNGVWRYLSIVAMVALLISCAMRGAHFWQYPAINELVGYFIAIVGVEITLLLCASGRGLHNFGSHLLQPRTTTIARFLALALPVPIIAYALFGTYVQNCQDSSASSMKATETYVSAETFLFGRKRACKHFEAFARKQFWLGNYTTAIHYYMLGYNARPDKVSQ